MLRGKEGGREEEREGEREGGREGGRERGMEGGRKGMWMFEGLCMRKRKVSLKFGDSKSITFERH